MVADSYFTCIYINAIPQILTLPPKIFRAVVTDDSSNATAVTDIGNFLQHRDFGQFVFLQKNASRFDEITCKDIFNF